MKTKSMHRLAYEGTLRALRKLLVINDMQAKHGFEMRLGFEAWRGSLSRYEGYSKLGAANARRTFFSSFGFN